MHAQIIYGNVYNLCGEYETRRFQSKTRHWNKQLLTFLRLLEYVRGRDKEIAILSLDYETGPTIGVTGITIPAVCKYWYYAQAKSSDQIVVIKDHGPFLFIAVISSKSELRRW